MKFTIVARDTQAIKSTHVLTLPVGSQICGMQMGGHRPQTVELDFNELRYLNQNPDYLKTIMLALSYKPPTSAECGV